MRQLLQNKKVVAVLATMAVVAVGWRVHWVYQRLHPASGVQAREVAPSPPPAPAPPLQATANPAPVSSPPAARTVETSGNSRLAERLQDWTRLISDKALVYDPFGPVLQAETPEPIPSEALPDAENLRLQAISIAPGQSFAVIDHQILAPGETIGEFSIERIERTAVWLSHPRGTTVLRLDFLETSLPAPASPDSAPTTLSQDNQP